MYGELVWVGGWQAGWALERGEEEGWPNEAACTVGAAGLGENSFCEEWVFMGIPSSCLEHVLSRPWENGVRITGRHRAGLAVTSSHSNCTCTCVRLPKPGRPRGIGGVGMGRRVVCGVWRRALWPEGGGVRGSRLTSQPPWNP